MSLPEAVLFDLDGTLIDTAPDFIDVVNCLLREEGKKELPDEIIRNTVSNGARGLINLAFNISEEDADYQNYRQRLLDLYSENLSVKSRLFQGMDLVLNELEKSLVPWGIVTNKPSQYAEPLISSLELSQRCSVLICPDHVSKTKPDPEPLITACEKISVDPVKSIYIGDHPRDILAGHNANMKTAVALFGYINPIDDPLSWGADYIAAYPLEIIDIVLKHYQ